MKNMGLSKRKEDDKCVGFLREKGGYREGGDMAGGQRCIRERCVCVCV